MTLDETDADWHEHEEAVAGALIILGGMLYEWGLPLEKAIRGLRAAYEMESKKSEYHERR